MPLLLEQQGVVDGEGDPGGDGPHEVAVEGVVVRAAPVGQVGQPQVHQPEGLAAHAQRRDDGRGHADLGGQAGVGLTRAGIAGLGEVLDEDRLLAAQRDLGVVPHRVADLRPERRPGVGRRAPALDVGGDPPGQPPLLHQLDEAVVGELRDEHLGDALERLLDVERPGEALADPLQQAEAVLLPLVAAHRLPGGDDDPRHRSRRMPQRHGLCPYVDDRPVPAPDVERALPDAALEDVLGELDGERVILLHDAQGEGLVTGPRGAGTSEQPFRERVPVEKVAEPVGDHHRHLGMIQDGTGRKVISGVLGNIPPPLHPVTAPRGRVCAKRTTVAPAVSAWERRDSRTGSNRAKGPRSASGDKNVRGNLSREIRKKIVRLVVTCHPHTVVARRERHLASGLYPNLLEFKHHSRIALHLFANSPHDNGYISGSRRSRPSTAATPASRRERRGRRAPRGRGSGFRADPPWDCRAG